MIDLHMHSNYSDGSESPEALVLEAQALKLSAIALTDHDTVEGIPEFMAAGRKHGLRTIPGVEISVDTRLPNNGHMHLLGLLIDPSARDLRETLNFLKTQRNLRAEKIIRKLTGLNIPITLEELLQEAGEGAIGRPHVARILLRKGVVGSIQEAFDLYLAKGKPAYMDKVKLDEKDALKMIHDARGLAILAHPHFMNFDSFAEAAERILEMQALGLDGFEVFYSGMPEAFSRQLIDLAAEHDMVISGGSDYHGSNKDHVKMGTGGDGRLRVPDALLPQLQERQRRRFTVAAS